MNQIVTSVCHDLFLLPASECRRFARMGAEAIMSINSHELIKMGIPGTIKVSEELTGGNWKKTITFDVRDEGRETLALLDRLRILPLMAFYTNSSHFSRVSGCPAFPLSLSFKPGEGVYSVTLSGIDFDADGFPSEEFRPL